ncbi:MAG: DUF2971 domain-containing protein [Paludibacter sp.]|nr:DUF2971 domain-containing protein [Paludibacter sp.]
MRKGYKYRSGSGFYDEDGKSLFKRDIEALVENQIYAPLKDKLNDPTETQYVDSDFINFLNEDIPNSTDISKIYNDLKLSIGIKYGIYSLSNTFKSELLWAYYASGHTGFCVEYDIDIIAKCLNYNQYASLTNFVEVDYQNKIPEINRKNSRQLFMHNNEKLLQTIIGTKSLSWKHEDEIRLIFEESGLIEIDFRAVTAIYFGKRILPEDMEKIMFSLKGRNLRYYKMDFVPNSYELIETPIEDHYQNSPVFLANDLIYDDCFLSKEYMEETYIHRGSLKKALEIVKHEPMITKIYQALVIGLENPEFRVFAYTKSQLAPIKIFSFKYDNQMNLIQY